MVHSVPGDVGFFEVREKIVPWPGGVGRTDNGKATRGGERVCVPQPSPDQAGSGWGTRGFGVGVRRTDNGTGLSFYIPPFANCMRRMGHPSVCGGLRGTDNCRGKSKDEKQVLRLRRQKRRLRSG
jgi:hypothetical protein